MLQRQSGHIALNSSEYAGFFSAQFIVFFHSSQFSPIYTEKWCLVTMQAEKKNKSNKWKKVEQKQNCDGFYLPYCMCGDRSVAWEWSKSHVYWAFDRCIFLFECMCINGFFQWIFYFVKLDGIILEQCNWMAFSRRCRCQWQHRRFHLGWMFFSLVSFSWFFFVSSFSLHAMRFLCSSLLFVLSWSFFRFFAELWIVIAYESRVKSSWENARLC